MDFDSMVNVHFTAVGALAAFAASVAVIFKEKQWNDKKKDTTNDFIKNSITVDYLSPMRGDDLQNKSDHAAFIGILLNNADLLDAKMRRLYTLYSWFQFVIFLSCMLSVVEAYHARLWKSSTCYFSAYILASSAFILIAFYVIIVFLPTWVVLRLNEALSVDQLRHSFRNYQEKMDALRGKSDLPDLGFRID